MEQKQLELLLKNKQEFVVLAAGYSKEENKLIKNKVFDKIAGIDVKKNEAIKNMLEADKQLLLASKDGQKYSENAKETVNKINTALYELITLEKENELLISQAVELQSGKYINSYKAYKHSK
ncbi:MAG: hypothetical protein WCJ94_03080 [bacterium]